MMVPSSTDGFTNESCVAENGKAKMIKNSNENKKLYCVSLKTAKILEDRGWGINFGDNDYFLKTNTFSQTCNSGCTGRGIILGFTTLDIEKDKWKLDGYEKECQNIVSFNRHDEDHYSESICEIRFYNDTWKRMMPHTLNDPDNFGKWVDFETYWEIFR